MKSFKSIRRYRPVRKRIATHFAHGGLGQAEAEFFEPVQPSKKRKYRVAGDSSNDDHPEHNDASHVYDGDVEGNVGMENNGSLLEDNEDEKAMAFGNETDLVSCTLILQESR